MNLAFADRDFYYGDPYFRRRSPSPACLSKEYARQRYEQIDWERNNPDARPGDPYPFQGRRASLPEAARKVGRRSRRRPRPRVRTASSKPWIQG